jgi:hypothetical protein
MLHRVSTALAVTFLCAMMIALDVGCPRPGGGGTGGGGNATGTVDFAYACENPNLFCSRSFSYTLTPVGPGTTISGSQPCQRQPISSISVNGNQAAMFSWVQTGIPFGTWNLTLSARANVSDSDTNCQGLTQSITNCSVTLTAGAPQQKVNVDNLANTCVVGDENNARWP